MKIKGIKTDSSTLNDEEIEVNVEFGLRHTKRSLWISDSEFEGKGFYVDDKNINIEKMKKDGWIACSGAPHIYNKLFIPPKEMIKIFEKFKL